MNSNRHYRDFKTKAMIKDVINFYCHIIVALFIWVGYNHASGQSRERNYVMVVEPLAGSAAEPGTDYDMSRVTVNYFDGLGRGVSTVKVGASYAVQDMADFVTYDGRGRVCRQYLPFETSSSSGEFPMSAEATAQAYHDDFFAFSLTSYDGTADSRVTAVTGPGVEWHASGKAVRTLRRFNNAVGEGAHSCLMLRAQGDSLFNRGAYEEGRLRVTVTIDENGDSSAVYTDKGGRTVLQRRFLGGGQRADTYFAYDICHRLRFVISPEGSKRIATDLGVCDRETLYRYANYYEYDGRNRCVVKRLAGQEPVCFVYDRLNRVIFSQNGVQRLVEEWSVRKYDSDHRLAVEGRVTMTDATRSSLQELWGDKLLIETHDASIMTESRLQYTDTCGIAGFIADRAFFYDDYSHWSGDGLSMPIPSDPEYPTDMTYPPKGLMTGTAVSDYNGNHILTLNVYDPKGNVVLSAERDCYANEYMVVDFSRFNFTGELLRRKRVTSLLSEQVVTECHTERWSYTLDNWGRVTMITHQYGDLGKRVLAEYAYDDAGRVSRWNYPGGSVVYDRNPRGWLTLQQSDRFSQTLRYNTATAINGYYGSVSSTPRYNGDISAISETRYLNPDSAGVFSRVIRYDRSGQITEVLDEEPERFNERLEYDLNGNILNLIRGDYGDGGNGFDDLYLEYDGNRLAKIVDYTWDDRYLGEIPQLVTTGVETEYSLSYDAGGRLTSDGSRSITSISYTPEHLPTHIDIAGDSLDIYLTYRADGVKRSEQTRRRYIKVITRVDAEGNVTTTNRPMTENIVRRYYGSLVTETGRDRRIYNEVGYIDIHNGGDSVSYHYYERDWLGSVRVVVDERGNIEQATDYHMGGLPSSRLTALNADRRLHTGKELLTFHGISLYDNQARWYDPILCRFTTPDPLAEKYPALSPYSHCANNPLTIIDPSGKVIDFIWDAANVLYDVSMATYNHVIGDHDTAMSHWVDATVDAASFFIPLIPAGATKVGKATNVVTDIATPTRQATRRIEMHHVIPRQHQDHPLVRQAIDEGWEFNGSGNLIPLEKYSRQTGTGVHGNHPKYNTEIYNRLEDNLNKPGSATDRINGIISDVIKDINNNPQIKINDLYPKHPEPDNFIKPNRPIDLPK